MDKSAVYRINPDNTVETLWSSKEENVYDLLALEKQLLFSTDQDGRIYGLAPGPARHAGDRKPTKARPRGCCLRTIRCWPPPATWAASSGWAKRPVPSGSYEAPVHDAGTASRWGSAELARRYAGRLRAGVPHPLRQFRQARPHLERLVGAARPTPPARRITSPNARYIQWKAELAGSARRTPVLDSVTVAYLPQNSPPVVKSINVVTQAAAAGPDGPRRSAQSAAPTASP